MKPKSVLITGGSRGLGYAMAVAMTEQGHRVTVTGQSEQKLKDVASALPGCLTIGADVANAAQTASVIEEVQEKNGPVDVLINNAGIGGGQSGPQALVDTDADTWWRVLETNLRGPMLYSKAVLPMMLEGENGIIINIGSYIAIRPSPMATAYASSKAALARFTDCLAEEVTGQGVQVFCVSPGLVLTDMTRDLPFIKSIPQQDFFRPEDVASLTRKLITGKYAQLSGNFIHVGDDLAELIANAEKIRAQRLHQLSMHSLDGLID